MASDPNCVFCKIVAGQLPAAIVLQAPAAAAFLDIQPLARGHLLVIPPDHYPTLNEMPGDALARLTAELPRLSRALLAAVEAPALTLTCNNGRAAGQEVDHVHFHLIPRWPDDGLSPSPHRAAPNEPDRNAVRDRIMAALGGV